MTEKVSLVDGRNDLGLGTGLRRREGDVTRRFHGSDARQNAWHLFQL